MAVVPSKRPGGEHSGSGLSTTNYLSRKQILLSFQRALFRPKNHWRQRFEQGDRPTIMILGLGIDLCDVRRMRRQLDNDPDGFAGAVFKPAEIAYCNSKHRPAEHFAARFAAKEAVVKALSAAGGEGSFWQDIEIIRTADGQPRVELSGRLRELADGLGAAGIHLSITHTDDMAAAVAVVEGAVEGPT